MTTRRSLPIALAAALMLPGTSAHADDLPERVIMKLEEFLRLYESVRKPAPRPPRDSAMASARYRGEVLFDEGKPTGARFAATQRIEVLQPTGWVRVPLLPISVALQSAKIAGREAAVVIDNGFYTLVTDRRGAFDVELTFGAGISSAEGHTELGFQLPPSGATQVQLAVPTSDDLEFTVPGAQLLSDRVQEGKRVVEATIAATGSLSVQWQRQLPAAEHKDARVYAETQTLVSVGDGLLRATSTIQQTILFASIDHFRFTIPKGMTPIEVQGPGVREWKLAPDGALEVNLNYAAEGSHTLVVQLERPLSDDSKDLPVPTVTPLGIERHRGYIGIESRGNLEIATAGVEGATPVDVRTLPAAIVGLTDQPLLLGFKFVGNDAHIGLTTGSHPEVDVLVSLIDETSANTIWTAQGRRITSVRYRVRNNRRQFLRLSLPTNAELWSASVEGSGVQPARGDDGKILIPMVRSQEHAGNLSSFEVDIVYVEQDQPADARGRGRFNATLPIPDVPSTYVAWTIESPKDIHIGRWSHGGSLQHVDVLSNPMPVVSPPDHSQLQEYAKVSAKAEVLDLEVDTMGNGQRDQVAVSPPALPAPSVTSPAKPAAMGQGATPVRVALPSTNKGKLTYYEKLLAFGDDENLTVEFRYRGLRR